MRVQVCHWSSCQQPAPMGLGWSPHPQALGWYCPGHFRAALGQLAARLREIGLGTGAAPAGAR